MPDLHIHFHFDSNGSEPNSNISKEVHNMSLALEQLTKQIEANTEVESSAITLLHELAGRIDAHKNDPAELSKLVTLLKTSGDSLAAAIVANTPAADTPEDGSADSSSSSSSTSSSTPPATSTPAASSPSDVTTPSDPSSSTPAST
jgi:hypothetical protein